MIEHFPIRCRFNSYPIHQIEPAKPLNNAKRAQYNPDASGAAYGLVECPILIGNYEYIIICFCNHLRTTE